MKTKNLVFGLIIAVVLGVIVFFATSFFKKNDRFERNIDQYGCDLTAGYTWCEPENRCVGFWEDPCQEKPSPTLVPVDPKTILERIIESAGFKTRDGEATQVKWKVFEEVMVLEGTAYFFQGEKDQVDQKFKIIDDLLRKEFFTKKVVDYDPGAGASTYFAYKKGKAFCNLKVFDQSQPASLEISCAISN